MPIKLQPLLKTYYDPIVLSYTTVRLIINQLHDYRGQRHLKDCTTRALISPNHNTVSGSTFEPHTSKLAPPTRTSHPPKRRPQKRPFNAVVK